MQVSSVLKPEFRFDRAVLFSALLLGILAIPSAFAAPSVIDADAQGVIARLPLRFEAVNENKKQWVSHSLGFTIGFTNQAAVIGLGDHNLAIEFAGSNTATHFSGEQKSVTPTNHIEGKNSHTSDTFLKLRQAGVYPGVDVVYYGQGQSLEYDFELAPGADPSKIRVRFVGADATHLSSDGSLVVTLNGREITQRTPVTYQRRTSGEVVSVRSEYIAQADGSYSIRLGEYDRATALVIDPQVLFTTYLGGGGSDGAIGLARDKNNTIYIAGATRSTDFPQTGNTYPNFFTQPNEHIFITKLNPLLTGDQTITYSGFFGGEFGDQLKAFAVDSEGVIHMAGLTDDFFFPVTANAYLAKNGGVRKMFYAALDTKIGGASSLLYATFFGAPVATDGSPSGIEEPTAIALNNGKAYITGFTNSDTYPVKNSIQATRTGASDVFVAEFDSTKSGDASLLYSTYLGGFSNDIPQSIAVDSAGLVYVAGYTPSFDFPTTPGSYKPFYSGGTDAFVSKLDLTNKTLVYSTFLGGRGIDQASKVVLDKNGYVAVAGFTLSDNYPITANAMQTVAGGDGDTFLTILNMNAAQFTDALVYSTLYGGSGAEVPYDMRIGPSGAYYIVGYTLSRDLPVRDALSPISAGQGVDGFVAIIDTQTSFANALIYSSYVTGGGSQIVRGIEVDPQGLVYVTGSALGNIVPVGQAPANSSTNAFLFVFKPSPAAVVRQDSIELPAAISRRR
ncbi:MAG: SBBP repeat-containing protein [Acidobacteriota bacterium]